MKKTMNEFKEFIMRGNILDMAIGVIMGTAFGKIVTSLVNDVIMPAVGLVMGGVDFANLAVTIGDETITYGAFIQNIIDFLIIAVCMFIVIKVAATVTSKRKKAEEAKQEEPPKKPDDIVLLEEIRDLLKNNEIEG